MWSCYLDGTAVPYPDAIDAIIEAAYQRGDPSVNVSVRGVDYICDFSTMRQIVAKDKHKRRQIERSAGSATAAAAAGLAMEARLEQLRQRVELLSQRLEAHSISAVETVELQCSFDEMDDLLSRVSAKIAPQSPPGTGQQSRTRPATARVETVGRPGGMKTLCHMTSQAGANAIVTSQTFNNSAKGMLGPMVYFARGMAECQQKALGGQGVLLSSTVELGRSVVSRTGSHASELSKMTLAEAKAWLQSHSCDSVYGTDLRTGDEWAVPNNPGQITNIRVSGYVGLPAGAAAGAAPALQPFWLWPQWVQTVADSLGVDQAEVDRVATQPQYARDKAPAGTAGNVRVNAAGRPIHSDGKFMSYATARSRGWQAGPLKKDGTPDMRYSVNKAAAATAARPSSARGPTKADGTPDMRYSANKAAYGGGSSSSRSSSYGGGGGSSYSSGGGGGGYSGYSGGGYSGGGYSGGGYSGGGGGGSGYSGSACYSVSSNPSGPMKADGTPDMRYSANRR